MPKRKKNAVNDPIVKELGAVKRLLALLLLKAGASQDEIALALQIDQADVSRMLPKRKVKPFKVK